MDAEVRKLRTAAEDALAASFATASAALPGTGGVAALRADAFRRFESEGLPNRRVEEWKYTDLRALMREALPLAQIPDAVAKARIASLNMLAGDLEARRIVFVDGAFVPELSDLADLEHGLTIRSMSAALAANVPPVAAHLGKTAPHGDVAVALNTAFMGDGALISVAAQASLARPIHLVFANSGAHASAVFTRSVITVEEGARAMVVESHLGTLEARDQINSVVELQVG